MFCDPETEEAAVHSLPEVLARRAAGSPQRQAFAFLEDGETAAETLSYGELAQRTATVAAGLRASGGAGQRVLVLLRPGLAYVTILLGCLLAGAVAVPAYPPRHRRTLPRLRAVVEDAEAALVVTEESLLRKAEPLGEGLGALRWLLSEQLEAGGSGPGPAAGFDLPLPDPHALALLQYTSGSTGDPKGVMLTHAHLMANQAMIREAFGTSPESVVVSWLPLYHDMGLIGAVFHPLYLGASCVLMAPERFLQRPARWLRAIDRHGGTISGAPDFAYDLCARKISEEERAGLDLSRWQVAFNGAEPVRAGSLRRFVRAFAGSGFRPAAFHPCYGLAEASLLVAGGRRRHFVRTLELDAAALEGHRVVPVETGEASGVRELVSCGRPASAGELRVVDPQSRRPAAPGQVGEVWVRSGAVAAGYWRREELSRETFAARVASEPEAGPFLRTGDLGFVDDGELFVTGRLKDLVVLRGRNHYPQDLEATAESAHAALRPGGAAAFSVEDEEGGERLVLVLELEPRARPDTAEVIEAVRGRIAEDHEVSADAVVLLPFGGLPRTSSGKVRRRHTRDLYRAGRLEAVAQDAPGGEADGGRQAGTVPATAVERRLAALWCEVLEVETVSLEASFFQLGGDSLHGTRLAALVSEAFGREVSLDDLFEHPTLGAFAAFLEGDASRGEGLPPVERRAAGGGEEPDAAPLTFAQRRLWFLHQLAPDNPVHQVAAAVRLEGPLEVARLERALAQVLHRHEALRTAYRTELGAGEPVQRAEALREAALVLVEPAEGESAAVARAWARRPFDLGRPPLARALLLRHGPQRHELVLAVHHIACDGWSLGVLLDDLLALYQGESLPELPVRYADYAVWQRGHFDEASLAGPLAFWRRYLAVAEGGVPAAELPADRPRPPVLSHRGAHLETPLPAGPLARLHDFAAAAGGTPFLLSLSLFGLLLSRHTGRRDFLVGTPVAGRERPELEGLVGCFLNLLPLRLPGDAGEESVSFADHFAAVRESALAAYAQRRLPFERLVDEVTPERDPSRTPLFQILFVMQNAPLVPRRLGDLRVEPRELDLGTARFDLAVNLAETGQGPLAIWKYAADLYDATTVRRWAEGFARLIEAAAEDPRRPLPSLDCLSPAQRQQLVAESNDTALPLTGPLLLHELVAARAEQLPGAPAVVFRERELSYAELLGRARALARRLVATQDGEPGVGPEEPVGVLLERSEDLVVAVLGVLLAGAAYLPLEPDHPAERRSFQAADAGLRRVVTCRELAAEVPAGCRAVWIEDEKDAAGESAGQSAPPRVAEPASPAYVIYTSGTTGRPKGVMVPHEAIVNRLVWMQRQYPLRPGERVLHKTPFGFDVSVWELFWPLMVGAVMVVAEPRRHGDTAHLAELIRRHGVSTLHFVPSMLQAFLEEPAAACPSLRRVIASGEALPASLARRFAERLGPVGARLHNLYGPTEAAVDVTFEPAPARPPAGRATVPIGRPTANTAIHLVDDALRLVPPGATGEVLIGGVQLARGYLGRPALTAERFVPDPFAVDSGPIGGGRLYRTGDLGRRLPGGEVEYLGRRDFQVKIRGVRVEVGEVEAALAAQPAVREAAVLALPGAGGALRLVAFVVPAGPAPADLAATLGAALSRRLPAPMVPGAFVVLEALPLSANGKVDRKALARLETVGEAAPAARRPPESALELRLAALWQQVLELPQLPDLDSSFFELGGDSVRGALMINRLQAQLGETLYVMTLFDAPSLGQLARRLEADYGAAVARWLGSAAREETGDETGAAAGREVAPDRATQEADVAALAAAAARRWVRPGGPAPASEPVSGVVLILSPFRSGSTLLRVMLAGHSRLFSPPELELLHFDTLGQRARAFSGRDAFSGEGLLRAVMELWQVDVDEARRRLARLEAEERPVGALYRDLLHGAGGRLLVDKTPSYALVPETLERAERLLAGARYLYLKRHPQATVNSYLEARMDQAYRFPLPARRQAEAVWTLAQRNLLAFRERVPAERWHEVAFEALVREPREVMAGVCAFLGLELEAAMLDPYAGPRMTDGLTADGRMMGDPHFHQHRRIEPAVADSWQKGAAAPLGPVTLELAARLGYGPAKPESARAAALDAGGEAPLAPAQERLWFLARLLPEASAAYHMPAAVELTGALDAAALASAFGEVRRRHQVLRTAFPLRGGEGLQLVAPATQGPMALPVVDLTALPPAAARSLATALETRFAELPFDLGTGPLLRLALLRLAGAHRLLVGLHHVVADGWSVGVLIREVAALYDAFRQGHDAALPALPLQYGDFARRQRAWLEGEEAAAQLAWWRQQLAGAPPVLELPADRPRPPRPSFRGRRLLAPLGPGLRQAVEGLARRQGTTPFVVLAAAFQAFQARFTGRRDVLCGTPVAGRGEQRLEGLIGCFVNTLPLRTRVAPEASFAAVVAGLHGGVAAALRRQEVPFERIVEALAPERSLAYAPVFQSLLVLQNQPMPRLRLAGLELETREVFTGHVKLDLLLAIAPPRDEAVGSGGAKDAGEWLAGLDLAADLFDLATGRRFLAAFRQLLAGAVATPERPVAELALLAPAQRQQLLVEWNDTAEKQAAAPSLHGLVAAAAARSPEAVAVEEDAADPALSTVLTYRQLLERAAGVAAALRALGVGPEDLVGVALERGADLVVALLGVLRAGAAYLPLEPDLPRERLAFLARDSGIRALLTAGPPSPVAAVEEPPVPRLDPAKVSPVVDFVDAPVAPEGAAYVIYTSGSTGQPKGAVISHRGIVNRLRWMQRAFRLSAADAVLQKTPMGFDVSVWEFFWPLATGARLVMARPGGHRDPRYLVSVLERRRITTLHFVPSMLELFLEAPGLESRESLRGLRRVVASGEALPPALVERFFARLPGAELDNLYGPTEASVDVTAHRCRPGEGRVPIGRPVDNVRLFVVDAQGRPVPPGVAGELLLGGVQLARGYLGRPGLTARSFVPDGLSGGAGERLYRTGDLVRFLPGGAVEYLGRIDFQVKVRGVRIELGEVEEALRREDEVREAVVLLRREAGEGRLVAYVTLRGGQGEGEDGATRGAELRRRLGARLPEAMVPAAVRVLEALPLLPNGKVDRRALAALPLPWTAARQAPSAAGEASGSATERRVAAVWRRVLGREDADLGLDENFFDVGGHSLLALRLQSRLEEVFGRPVEVVDLFQHTTIRAQARLLGGAVDAAAEIAPVAVGVPARSPSGAIAVVALTGRFPGAASVEALWRNLCAGTESITAFGRDELLAAGTRAELVDHPRLVAARGVLEGIEEFDADLFGFSPREAELTDPQHRLFLELAWEALELCGWDPRGAEAAGAGRVGVFAGTTLSTYLLNNLGSRRDELRGGEAWQVGVLNQKSALATRISYKLGLSGPSMAVQTACSSSLVAVHMACRALLDGECDTALAGGVTIRVPQVSGLLHEPGGIQSPDGHCRPFDADAAGTVFGSGAGLVVLRRLEDAVAAGERVRAVIRGTAVANDGAARAGFTAPGVDGQATVVSRALAVAGVDPASVGFVEAHGTGTPLGDPIEARALTRAFRGAGDGAESVPAGRCALGSIKSNVGHLDAAAGIAGLIKAVLAVESGEVPPTAHFRRPNPALDLEATPFFVNDRLIPWPLAGGPRRAGVSAFGIGGTNAHVVVEEPPASRLATSPPRRGRELLVVSAHTPAALDRATTALGQALGELAEGDLADVAHTLQTGRHALRHRRAVVAASLEEARRALLGEAPGLFAGEAAAGGRVGWLFSGQGSQHPGMMRALWQGEPRFQEALRRGFDAFLPELDLEALLFPAPGRTSEAAAALRRTENAQPALFAVEYALARQWQAWGVRPAGLLGHSVGEYVAACLAGVFTLEDALALVALRGRLVQGLEPGAMLALPLPEAEVLALLAEGAWAGEVELAAVNAPEACVVAGPAAAVSALAESLATRAGGVQGRRLHTSHAFHTRAVEPILDRFAEEVARRRLSPPAIPFVSAVTGTWIRPEEATNPEYWRRQLRRPVRFADAVATLAGEAEMLLEVGPGTALTSLARRQVAAARVVASQPSAREAEASADGAAGEAAILAALGRLWTAGVEVDWRAVRGDEVRRRVTLPTYPFERHRHWVEVRPATETRPAAEAARQASSEAPARELFTRVPPLAVTSQPTGTWLVLRDSAGLGCRVLDRLERAGARAVVVEPGREFALGNGGAEGRHAVVDPHRPEHFRQLLAALEDGGEAPSVILHLWAFQGGVEADPARTLSLGYEALRGLAAALAARPLPPRVVIAADGLLRVTTAERTDPEKALLLSALGILGAAGAACRIVDLDSAESAEAVISEALLPESPASDEDTSPLSAYREGQRWLPAPRALAEPEPVAPSRSAPRTAVHAVEGAFREVLGLRDRPVSAADDFFEMGGDSLLALQVVSRLREDLNLAVELEDVFTAPTVAGLVERLEARQAERAAREESVLDTLPLRPHAAGDRPPLSFAQHRLWFLDRLEPGNAAYNLPVVVRLRGELDHAALAAALARVVRRHEVLRTTFPDDAGLPWQRIEEGAPELPLVELPATEGRDAALTALVAAACRRPFDLERGPLLRCLLVSRGAGREHVLVLVLHHIVGDGGSLAILLEELAAFYDPTAEPPEPLALQYADYAVWQREVLSEPVVAARLAWWRERFAGHRESAELPTDRPRPALQSFAGRRLPWHLGSDLTGRLEQLARQQGATLFTVLLAAFAAVLSRWTGSSEVVVGTPASGRDRRELEALVGLFLNTLPLRLELAAAGLRFADLLAHTREVVTGAREHGDVPFERLVHGLAPQRDLARNPLFQVLFAYLKTPLGARQVAGLELVPEEFDPGTAQLDLTFNLALTQGAATQGAVAQGFGGSSLRGYLEYATQLYDAATIHRLGRGFRTLLAAAVAAPQAPVAALPVLEAGEWHQLRVEWNEACWSRATVVTVPETLAVRAGRHPMAPVVDESASGLGIVTYRDLDARATALARQLRRLGVGPEERIAVALVPSAAAVTAIVGIWKAGAAYVPVDPDHPAERRRHVLEDSGARLLITGRAETERLRGDVPGLAVLTVEDFPPADPVEAQALPLPAPALDRLAYVLYTSGSTGRPKGVAVAHRALATFLAAMAQRPGCGEGDRLLAVTTLSFDISLLEHFLPLITGACLCPAPRAAVADAVRLAGLLASTGATLMQATPASWRLLLDGGWQGSPRLIALCGGEALPGDLARRLAPRCRELWNLYGPTETTVWSAAGRVEPEGDESQPPLGPAIAGTALHLLGRQLETVPVGGLGEVVIGGAGLARGYLGRPGLTAERFVPDGVGGESGARLYATGDLARRRRNGRLEFLGRRDHQVKIRGFRIELGEVEAALAAHPDVRAVVATARRRGQAVTLVAHVVPERPEAAQAADRDLAAELRALAEDRLPAYMVPATFDLVAQLPRNSSGKVDRRALEARSLESARGPRTAPASEAERALAAIWEEVLGVPTPAREDSFFELGGDSVTSVRVVAAATASGYPLAARDVFRHPQLAALAAVAAAARQEGLVPQAPGGAEQAANDVVEENFPQARLSREDLEELLRGFG